MEVEVAELWSYRGEGAANLVLAYQGDDPALIGKVLRLRKGVKNRNTNASHGDGNSASGPAVLSIDEQEVWANWPSLPAATTIAELNHVYARDVLVPLLGDRHVDPGSLVNVSGSFVASLSEHIADLRPSWRAEVGTLEAQSGVGFLISDHTCFKNAQGGLRDSPPTISLELKPKCGFLPTSPMMKEENRIKRSVSRFVMHQQLKFQQGKVKCLSKYDPLDLFSGTREGILKAVQALFETPQNNLRVFRNGEEVFGESIEGLTTGGSSFGMQNLEDVLEGFVMDPVGGRVQAFQELVANLLFEDDMLRTLLAVQNLDYCDVEGAIHAYDKFIRYRSKVEQELEREKSVGTEEEWEGVGSPQLKEAQFQHRVVSSIGERRKSGMDAFELEDCRKILQDFLIATTAKDCGVMLSLQPLSEKDRADVVSCNKGASIVSSSNMLYLQKVVLLDLDVKRLKKMRHYLTLDQEIVKAYSNIHAR